MSSDERLEARLWPSRRSLAWKIAAWGAAGSITVVLAFGIALYLAMMAQVRSIDEQVLLKRALRVRDVIQTSQSVSEWLGHEVSEDLEAPRQVFIRVIGADAVMLAETPGMADMAPAGLFPAPSILGRRELGDIAGATRHLRALTMRVAANGVEPTREAIIQVAVDTSIDERLLGQFRGVLLIALPFAAFACIVLAAAVASRFLKPLRVMTRDAEQLDAAEVGARLSVHGGADEIAELARAFNGVLIRLEEARERLKHYADTIAHEIRTPLNRMLLNSEIALREKRSAADYEEIIESQAQECSALSHLAQRLLFLARAESSDIVHAREMMALSHEFEVLRAYFEAGAADAGVSMNFEVKNDGLTLHAERTLFQQAIGNLLTNAIAHTPRGGAISVSARLSDGGVELLVSDNGEGIEFKHLPHVFERFYRGGSGVEVGRVGLGLAITKSIVEMHGGRISIESAVGAGATIRMWWPDGR